MAQCSNAITKTVVRTAREYVYAEVNETSHAISSCDLLICDNLQ